MKFYSKDINKGSNHKFIIYSEYIVERVMNAFKPVSLAG